MPLSDEETSNLRQNVGSDCPTSREYGFRPPQSGDSRSACPALNAMANHSYINHDGKKLSPCAIHRGLKACYGLSTPLALFLTFAMFVALRRIRSMDLHDIAKHNLLEHDASLVRSDTPDGEEFAPITIDQNLVDELMNDVKHEAEDSSGTESVMDLYDAARARLRRENACRPINFIRQEIARGEIALSVAVSETTSKRKVGAPIEWIRSLIGHERIPDNWHPTHTQGLWDTIKRSQTIRRAVAEMRKNTDKIANTSTMLPASDSNSNGERQPLLSPSKKPSWCTIF